MQSLFQNFGGDFLYHVVLQSKKKIWNVSVNLKLEEKKTQLLTLIWRYYYDSWKYKWYASSSNGSQEAQWRNGFAIKYK